MLSVKRKSDVKIDEKFNKKIKQTLDAIDHNGNIIDKMGPTTPYLINELDIAISETIREYAKDKNINLNEAKEEIFKHFQPVCTQPQPPLPDFTKITANSALSILFNSTTDTEIQCSTTDTEIQCSINEEPYNPIAMYVLIDSFDEFKKLYVVLFFKYKMPDKYYSSLLNEIHELYKNIEYKTILVNDFLDWYDNMIDIVFKGNKLEKYFPIFQDFDKNNSQQENKELFKSMLFNFFKYICKQIIS